MPLASIHPLQLDLIIDSYHKDSHSKNWILDICFNEAEEIVLELISNQDFSVVSNIELIKGVFQRTDPKICVKNFVKNKELIKKNQTICQINGNCNSILKSYPLVDFLFQKSLSISTATFELKNYLLKSQSKILEPRFFSPGYKLLEKIASIQGGANNRRLFFMEAVSIAPHHLAFGKSVTEIINILTESLSPTIKIEVQTNDLNVVQEAIDAGADYIILESISLAKAKMASKICHQRALLEIVIDDLTTLNENFDIPVDFVSLNLQGLRSRVGPSIRMKKIDLF